MLVRCRAAPSITAPASVKKGDYYKVDVPCPIPHAVGGRAQQKPHRWFLGEPPHIPIGIEGVRLHVGSTVQRTVAFIGVSHAGSAGGIHCTGTAFLMHYKGHGYIVTARHCVEEYEGREYLIRVNKGDHGANLLVMNKRWHYHDDEAIDVAVCPMNLTVGRGFQCEYMTEDILLTETAMSSVDVGQICYTVGLFRYIAGVERNLPLVYTGNIALFSETYIPVWLRGRQKAVKLWGSLIQTPGIHGASGSPVFVREPIVFGDDYMIVSRHIKLFGVLASAWFLPPDPEGRAEFGAKVGDTVPVGLGVVVQAPRIIEVLEGEELRAQREREPSMPGRSMAEHLKGKE